MKQKMFFGIDSVLELKRFLNENSIRNIFLVHGKNSFKASGAEQKVLRLLEGYSYSTFSDFSENPKVEDVLNGTNLFLKENYNLIIAVGGGSAIDIAKLINYNFAFNGNLANTDNNLIINNFKSLVAIPTTAGSGSEATHFAVLYKDNIKYSISHEKLLPELAIINPAFTYNLPKYIRSCCAIDALSQAIESYWSLKSTQESILYSEKAIKLLWPNIPLAVNQNNRVAQNKISKGAYLAGKAINIANTTAPHALSYHFSAKHKIPHGHAVALSLPFFIKYNSHFKSEDLIENRGYKYYSKKIEKLYKLLGILKKEEIKKILIQYIQSIGLDFSLPSDFDLTLLYNDINEQRLENNPIRFRLDQLDEVFKKFDLDE